MSRLTVTWESGLVLDLVLPASFTGLAVVRRIEGIDPSPVRLIRQHLRGGK